MSEQLQAGIGFSKEVVEAAGEDWAKISEINAALRRLVDKKQTAIEIKGLFRRSKIAWKVELYQQVSLHRVIMLAQGCADMWNSGKVIGAALCARSLMETAATLVDFRNQLARLCDSADLAGMDRLVTNRTLGTKLKEWQSGAKDHEAISVLTMLGKLDRLIPGLTKHYALLSEICHPNYLGHFGLFATLDTNTGYVELSDAKHRTPDTFNLMFTPFVLVAMVENADAIVRDLLPKIVELHEAHVSGGRGA